MLARMNIGRFIEKENSAQQQRALIELCLTVLHNSTQGLDFHDFTDNERLVWRMRRQEFDKVLAETRNVDNRLHALNSNFESHRGVAQNALAEFVTLVSQVKEELAAEVNSLRENHP